MLGNRYNLITCSNWEKRRKEFTILRVLKRNAYVFRKYEHFKAQVLLIRVYKNIGCHLG